MKNQEMDGRFKRIFPFENEPLSYTKGRFLLLREKKKSARH
jgi:hypothetical protein